MIKRYSNRIIFKNEQDKYKEYFRERNIKHINQYNTPEFIYPNSSNIGRITIKEHIWSVGDRFYKLAQEYYGDVEDWWVIAKFNNTPTESHIKLGDVILIPTPIHEVINIMKG